MYYVLVEEGVATKSTPELDPIFNRYHITEQYNQEYLDRCIKSDTDIPTGWRYDETTEAFSPPPSQMEELMAKIEQLENIISILIG